MFEELELASTLLRTTLDRYIDACNGVRNYYLQSGSLASIPLEYANHVGKEVSSFPVLEERLQKAKSLISWSRNCSATHSPINMLPPEILLYVFQLVISSQECLNRTPSSSNHPKHAPAYPDTLMHVCSRWRYIGVNSPTLWSHIDLLTKKALPLQQWAIRRAEAYAERSALLPLDVHFPIFTGQEDSTITEGLSGLLSRSTIATRARSLHIGFKRELNSNDSILHPLSKLFESCRRGTLTELTIHSDTVRVGGLFIDGEGTSKRSSESPALSLSLPKEHLESVLSGITSLQLRLIYFPWTSPVYHGLLELHLTGYQDCVSITESQLINILGASPRLRILEFGLHIRRESSKDTPTTPIRLEDLEALNLSMSLRVDVNFLLRCISPGSRPLQLSLSRRHPTAAISELIDSMQPFQNRSNMTTLHVLKFDFVCASILIGASAKLRTLAIDQLERGPSISSYKTRIEPCQLESLYLLDSFVILEDLLAFLGTCSTQTLVLWRTRFHSDSYSSGQMPDDVILQALSRVCRVVQWLSETAPNPTKIWDPFCY